MIFHVFVFECFVLAELGKLVVKSVCKRVYKQFLVAICTKSIAFKALKVFSMFLFIFFMDTTGYG